MVSIILAGWKLGYRDVVVGFLMYNIWDTEHLVLASEKVSHLYACSYSLLYIQVA